MPLQNRVDPTGELHAVADKSATLMGNRGILHDESRHVKKGWAHRNWVYCQLQWKGWHRQVFGPRTYSELFFLDEATALSAGHRPCNTCFAERQAEFVECWKQTNPPASKFSVSDSIDRVLHDERAIARVYRYKTFQERLSALPPGCFVKIDRQIYLVRDHDLLPWAFGGYGRPVDRAAHAAVDAEVLTPPSIIEIYRAGFCPSTHPSAM